jgi:hypothetical protein
MLFKRVEQILQMVILALLLAGLTLSCAVKPTYVLPVSRTEKVVKGSPAPFTGWMLTDGALTGMLEAAERCQKTQPTAAGQ